MCAFLIREEVYCNRFFRLCRIFRKSFSKNKYVHMKKVINYNVHNLNSEFLHIKMQNIKKNCTFTFFTLGLVGIIFFLTVDHRKPHRAFKSLLKYVYLG